MSKIRFHFNIITRALMSDKGRASIVLRDGAELYADFGRPFATPFAKYLSLCRFLSGLDDPAGAGELLAQHVKCNYKSFRQSSPTSMTFEDFVYNPFLCKYDSTAEYDISVAENPVTAYLVFIMQFMPSVIGKHEPGQALQVSYRTIERQCGVPVDRLAIEKSLDALFEIDNAPEGMIIVAEDNMVCRWYTDDEDPSNDVNPWKVIAELPGEHDRWMPVPGYEGLYEISEKGEVRAVDASLPKIFRREGKGGAVLVDLWKGKRHETRIVQSIVEVVFGGRKTVVQLDLSGIVVNVWPSYEDAAKGTGFDLDRIVACCIGLKRSYRRYVWASRDLQTPASK